MKNLLFLLALLAIISCKKKEDPVPTPVVPDYADSLVGSYLGHEIRYMQDNSTKEYENVSKTMTVTKLSKNRIQVSSFTPALSPVFSLSDGGSGDIAMTPESISSAGFNKYISSIKQLNIYIVTGSGSSTRYYYFQATKQ